MNSVVLVLGPNAYRYESLVSIAYILGSTRVEVKEGIGEF
jgi:hypothetical protein